MAEQGSRKREILFIGKKILDWLDKAPLWWIGFPLIAVTFAPYFILGEGSVFPIHDQMDETMMSYILNARHLFDKSDAFPEMLGGLNKSGLQPSAVLFVPLYLILPPLCAFLTQYFIVCASGFFGMYGSVKKLTGSSILALAAAGCFCLLPVQPVYGLSVMGVPLLLYAFLCLCEKKHLALGYLLIVFFGLTTHLVLIGYVALGLWVLYILIALIRKVYNRHIYFGFGVLTFVYILVNQSLFYELFLGKGSYSSHREEWVNSSFPFFETAGDVFLHGGQHAEALHDYLILPIIVLLIIEVCYCIIKRKRGTLEEQVKKSLYRAVGVMVLLAGIAFGYAFCRSQAVVDFKNSSYGFFRYFQAERFYWLYPALWHLEFALVFGVFWQMGGWRMLKAVGLVIVLLPTINLIKVNSYFYMNVNQINNGSGITGYISWESFYAEDLMQLLEETIGRDPSQYRIAHLGISPAPALMHGFYTVDGYSNNYSLEYKHRFRQVISRELAKNDEVRVYFDYWGSRCYLFNAVTGYYWMLEKNSGVQYENLEFDMAALKDLDCEYLFAGAEIVDSDKMGLDLLGYYETESSYWGIWLYEIVLQ